MGKRERLRSMEELRREGKEEVGEKEIWIMREGGSEGVHLILQLIGHTVPSFSE